MGSSECLVIPAGFENLQGCQHYRASKDYIDFTLCFPFLEVEPQSEFTCSKSTVETSKLYEFC